ncbi:hypothetical protein D3C75_526280 [compost metagenome]
MHGAAIFQVTDHGDIQVFQAALSFLNGEQIQQRLCWVLVRAITCIEHRHIAREFRRQTGGTFLRMAHHNGINIRADNRNGIGQGFAFFAQRSIAAVREPDHRRPQAMNGGFKREARAR